VTKPVTEPKPKAKTNAQKIAEMATKLAYKDKPEEAQFIGGKPTKAYQEALDKYYPNRKGWSAGPKKGAACDVFTGTVIRAAGVDKSFPRALGKQKDYLKNSKLFTEVKDATIKSLKNGDLIIYAKPGNKGHICIFVDGKIKEASIRKWYGVTTNTVKSRMSIDGKKWLKVYRAK
jgi:hypothetical protein